MKSFENLCDRVLAVINSNYPERTDDYEANIESLSSEIKTAGWNLDELLSLSDRAFSDDVQLHILFLSAVYLCSFDPAFLIRIETILQNDPLDIKMTSALLFQTRYYRFASGKSDDYPFMRQVNRHLSARFIRELGVSIDMIPYEQRNHDLIFVVTGQLLGERHAPSRLVLSLCWYLQKYFGYRVQLLVMGEPVDINSTAAYWAGDIVTPNYIPDWGDQIYRFHDEDIHYYQIDLNSASREKMIEVIGALYYKQPEFILQFGGYPRTDQLWRSMSTFISIPAGNNYDISDAHLLVSYQKNGAEAEEEFIHSQGQDTLFINLKSLPLTESATESEYTKTAFGIDENSFVISVIGNRLDDELTDEFKNVMSRILAENENVTFVIIGIYELPLPEDIDSHTVRLGYRQDFVQTVRITDLFLNPKRAGGAGGALRSLNNGIPIITLPDCDVSAFAGDDFVCNDYEEMISLTHKYITDKTFYADQSKKALQSQKNKTADIDIKQELQKLIDKAVEIGSNRQ